MSNLERRTLHLEEELSLVELISLWLRHIQRFESPAQYLLHIRDDLEAFSPAHQFLSQARRQLHNAPDAPSDKKRDEEICQSLRRLSFLQHLLWEANSHFEQLVIERIRRLELAETILETLDCECGHNQTSSMKPDDAALNRPGSVKNTGRFTERARNVVSDILCDQRAIEIAVESMSHRFFHNERFLLRSTARALEELRQAAELCATRLMQFSNGRPKARRSKFRQNQKIVQYRSAIMVRMLVDYAKALVRLRFGHKAQAFAAIEPHLRVRTDAKRQTYAPPRDEATQ